MPKKINLLMVCTSFPITKNSNSGIFIKHLVDNFSAKIDCKVLTPDSSSTNKSTDLHLKYQVIKFRYAPRKYQILAHAPGGIPAALNTSNIAWLLLPLFLCGLFYSSFSKSLKAQIIHANWSVIGVACSIVGILLHKPVITTLRGDDLTKAKKSWIFREILKLCLKLNTRIICVSNAGEDYTKSLNATTASKITHIPNGVSQDFLNIERPTKSTPSKSINILCVGSLIPRKDYATLLRAIAIITKLKNFKVILIGTGSCDQTLQDLAKKLNIFRNIEFKGSISHTSLPPYYSNADIFVHCSIAEGRPNVLLEAMASALPIIASDIDGHREIVCHKENGLLFATGNHNELAERILEISDNCELATHIKENARKYILENKLSWRTCAMQYESIYTELTKR